MHGQAVLQSLTLLEMTMGFIFLMRLLLNSFLALLLGTHTVRVYGHTLTLLLLKILNGTHRRLAPFCGHAKQSAQSQFTILSGRSARQAPMAAVLRPAPSFLETYLKSHHLGP